MSSYYGFFIFVMVVDCWFSIICCTILALVEFDRFGVSCWSVTKCAAFTLCCLLVLYIVPSIATLDGVVFAFNFVSLRFTSRAADYNKPNDPFVNAVGQFVGSGYDDDIVDVTLVILVTILFACAMVCFMERVVRSDSLSSSLCILVYLYVILPTITPIDGSDVTIVINALVACSVQILHYCIISSLYEFVIHNRVKWMLSFCIVLTILQLVYVCKELYLTGIVFWGIKRLYRFASSSE